MKHKSRINNHLSKSRNIRNAKRRKRQLSMSLFIVSIPETWIQKYAMETQKSIQRLFKGVLTDVGAKTYLTSVSPKNVPQAPVSASYLDEKRKESKCQTKNKESQE